MTEALMPDQQVKQKAVKLPDLTYALLSVDCKLRFKSIPSWAIPRGGVLYQNRPWDAALADIGSCRRLARSKIGSGLMAWVAHDSLLQPDNYSDNVIGGQIADILRSFLERTAQGPAAFAWASNIVITTWSRYSQGQVVRRNLVAGWGPGVADHAGLPGGQRRLAPQALPRPRPRLDRGGRVGACGSRIDKTLSMLRLAWPALCSAPRSPKRRASGREAPKGSLDARSMPPRLPPAASAQALSRAPSVHVGAYAYAGVGLHGSSN